MTACREMLPASSRDAVPAMSKSAGAVPATSMAKVAAAQHERKTWAVVAEELNHKPAACPLLRPRPEAAPQVGHAGGQAGAPVVWTKTNWSSVWSGGAESIVVGTIRLSLHCSAARWGCSQPLPHCRHQQAPAALL